MLGIADWLTVAARNRLINKFEKTENKDKDEENKTKVNTTSIKKLR